MNYFVRLRVTTHVTTAIVERLPVPKATETPAAFRQISALGRLLSRRSDAGAAARLQALVAVLYQLGPEEFGHIVQTFPLVSDAERDAALRAFATESQRIQR